MQIRLGRCLGSMPQENGKTGAGLFNSFVYTALARLKEHFPFKLNPHH